jgi:hypothetical protein
MAVQNYQLLTWDGTKQKRVDSEVIELKLGKLSIGSVADVEVALSTEQSARIQGDADTLAAANLYADGAVANFASSLLSGEIAALESGLAQEVLDRTAADNTLQSNISSEATARAAADTALQGEVDAVEAGLAQELIDRAAAVSAEEAARIAGDAATLSSANTYTDGKITDLVNGAPAILDTLKELSDALGADANFAATVAGQIAAVDAAVTAEVARATAAEGVLATDIAEEETRALAAEAALQLAIDDFQVQLNEYSKYAKQADESIAEGKICYVKPNGKVVKAVASVDLSQAQLLISAEAVGSGQEGLFYVLQGYAVGGFSGLTPGKKYFVSKSIAGEVVDSLSGFAAGDSVYAVGHAISASDIAFSPAFMFEY